MSRMATNEYIGAKRRLYATADRGKRIKILDEVSETTGYKRKYANRLLTGSRKFRERKGRGKTYGEEAGCISTGESASDCERYVAFRMLTPSVRHNNRRHAGIRRQCAEFGRIDHCNLCFRESKSRLGDSSEKNDRFNILRDIHTSWMD